MCLKKNKDNLSSPAIDYYRNLIKCRQLELKEKLDERTKKYKEKELAVYEQCLDSAIDSFINKEEKTMQQLCKDVQKTLG